MNDAGLASHGTRQSLAPLRMRAVFAEVSTLAVDAVVIGTHETFDRGNRAYEAVHQAAGPRLMAACRALGRVPVGEARFTKAYEMPIRHVIHAGCPVWRGGGHGETGLLAACYTNAIRIAAGRGIAHLGIPEIATGLYSFPPEVAAAIAVQSVNRALATAITIKEVLFCCYSISTLRLYENGVAKIGGEWGRLRA